MQQLIKGYTPAQAFTPDRKMACTTVSLDWYYTVLSAYPACLRHYLCGVSIRVSGGGVIDNVDSTLRFYSICRSQKHFFKES